MSEFMWGLLSDEETFIDVIQNILEDPDLDMYYEEGEELAYFIGKTLPYYDEALALALVDEAERRFLNGQRA